MNVFITNYKQTQHWKQIMVCHIDTKLSTAYLIMYAIRNNSVKVKCDVNIQRRVGVFCQHVSFKLYRWKSW